MRVGRSIIVLVLFTAGAAAAPASGNAFAPDSLRSWVSYLADDARQGRGAGTKGLDAAADWLAAKFQAAGLEPAGDGGSWFQAFEATIGVRPEGRNALRLAGRDFEFQSEWMAYGFSESATLTKAPLVFAGYGIRAPEHAYDDYAGLDVKGKVVLVLRYEPGKNDSASVFAGTATTAHADLRHKAILARELGAVGLLAVSGPAGDEPDVLAKLRPDVGYSSTGIPCGQVSRAALLAAIPRLDLAGWQAAIDHTGKPASRAVDGATVDLTVGLAKDRTRLRNVVGVRRGTDPQRGIVIGAHYDHLGMGGEGSLAPDANEPHNGADDNASGTAVLVGLARHFAAAPRPPISIVFAAFSGEELGLAGSAHYVKQPPLPLASTVAMLNMDMVGRLRDRKLQVFGTSTASEWTHLLEVVNAQGPKFDLRMKGDGYGPSDQMSFYKKDIAVLHFFTGAHSDYHRPSDDTERCDFASMSEIGAFVAGVAQATIETKLTFVKAAGPAPSSGDGSGGGGFRTRLGAIPDYGQDENLKGVLLSGVRAGSPGEKAGLRGGDVIVQMDKTAVSNIQDMMFVLNTHKPGDAIDIVVVRDGQRVTLPAVLGGPQQ